MAQANTQVVRQRPFLTRKERFEKRREALRTERESYISHWQDLSRHVQPRMSRFLWTQRNTGNRRHQAIVDPTATISQRTLVSGLMTGITSPARPWFELRTPDPDMNDFRPVRVWLDQVRQRMAEIFLASNLYTVLPIIYGDLSLYGTAAFAWMRDTEDFLRAYHYPCGSYYLGQSARNSVDTCIREFGMTTQQIVEKFGYGNASIQVQQEWDAGNYDGWHEVVHVLTPRIGPRNVFKLPYENVWYEKGTDQQKLLEDGGQDRFRVLAPRWMLSGEDIYGSNCPGMESLGDIRALQLSAKRKAQMVDKMVTPAMGAPSSLEGKRSSLLPGDVTYYDATMGSQKFEPLYLIDPRGYQALLEDIATTQNFVKRMWFEDLFLLIANDTRSNITAREIAERHEEKLLMLGPVLERMNDDLLDPLIDLTFADMAEAGLLPPAPLEIQGEALTVEYVSIMAQAMKLVGIQGLERFVSFAGNLAAVKPDTLDKVDLDEAIDQYGDMVGVPPSIINDDSDVFQMRQARLQQQQAMQAMQVAAGAAEGAKTLSETKLTDDNALNRMMDQLTGIGG